VTDVTDLSVTSGFSLPARVRTLGSTCELSVTSVTSVTRNGQDIDLKRLIGMLEKILDPSQSVTTRHNPSHPSHAFVDSNGLTEFCIQEVLRGPSKKLPFLTPF
jgi:hypothetical protein